MGWRYPAGGSLALVRIFDKAGAAVYADFQRYYGIDLGDLFRPGSGLTPKRIVYLVEGLPIESRTVAAIADNNESSGWGVTEYLIANLIDAVRENTFTNVQVRTKKKLAPPESFPVPGAKQKKKPKRNMFVQMAQRQLAQAQT